MLARAPRPNAKQVVLRPGDRRRLERLVERNDVPSGVYKRIRALLLLADGWAPIDVPEAVGCGEATVRRTRQRYDEDGIDGVITFASSTGRPGIFTKKDEARLVAMVCGDPPKGRSRWTIRLIAEEAVKRGVVKKIGKESVRLILQDHDLKPWRKKNVVRPESR